ncbi:hypothetical protein JHN55_03750 [Streptomyces sp. MBT56]|uniref:hypothetical protein n=1 Tax=unclassified Streptomyces TaxID=2593676 RepID=UPI00190AD82C|nr:MULTISPECIES: hypothetical protein [unclassified Streptomyces]MBK3555673.1 hypothetical protein [Streptomyces sp. MBT56]MBK3602410.1 hypothetical protein [Streptomyces sp. MBT54]MBK3617285.1 hypothetical protein [Streptomyces sp. MBT98]
MFTSRNGSFIFLNALSIPLPERIVQTVEDAARCATAAPETRPSASVPLAEQSVQVA